MSDDERPLVYKQICIITSDLVNDNGQEIRKNF